MSRHLGYSRDHKAMIIVSQVVQVLPDTLGMR
jgi:hypothetical protein